MTIEARSATASGAAASSASSTARRLARCTDGARRAGPGRRGRRAGARRPARRRRRSAPRPPRSRSAKRAGRRGRGLHGVDEVVGDLDAVEGLVSPAPVSASPRTTSAIPGAVTRAGSRAYARTSCPAAASRGARSAPMAPLAPVTRIFTADHDGGVVGCGRARLGARPATSRSPVAGSSAWPSPASCCVRRPGARVVVLERADAVGTGPDGPQQRRRPRRRLLRAGVAEGAAVRRGRASSCTPSAPSTASP